MVTGSLASSFYGEPRTTHDFDLVVAMTPEAVDHLAVTFPAPAYYLDSDTARSAIESAGTFNLLSTEEGDKIDFWMLTDSRFDRSRFERRRNEEVLGIPIQIPSPEDVMLAKLQWSKLAGGSQRQFVDVLRVYEVQGSALDYEYLNRWADELQVTELWQRVQDESEQL